MKRYASAVVSLALACCSPAKVKAPADWHVIGFLDNAPAGGSSVSFIDAASVEKIGADRWSFYTLQIFEKPQNGARVMTGIRAANRLDCAAWKVSVLEVTEWRDAKPLPADRSPGPSQWMGPGFTIEQAMRAVCNGNFSRLDPVKASALDLHALTLFRLRAALHAGMSDADWVGYAEDSDSFDGRVVSLIDRKTMLALPNGREAEFTNALVREKPANDGAVLTIFRYRLDCRARSITSLLAEEYGIDDKRLIDTVPLRQSPLPILPNTGPAKAFTAVCENNWDGTTAVEGPVTRARELIFGNRTAAGSARRSP